MPILSEGIGYAILAIVEIAKRVKSAPVVGAKRDGPAVIGFGVGIAPHVFVDSGHADEGVGIVSLDVQSALKFLERGIVFAKGGIEMAQGHMSSGEPGIDFYGCAATREGALDPLRMMIGLKL